MILITTAFGVVDLACYGQLRGDIQLGGPLPWQAVVAIFLALSVRSRVFSPLDNSRPELRAGRVSAEEDVELEAKLNAAKGKTRIKDLQGACEQRGLAFNAAMDRTELERRLRLYLAGAKRKEFMGGSERLRPSWTPPGVTFPIMWVLVVAPLRAFASSLVYETSTGRLNEAHLNDPVLLWLVLHLCIGDTWNTINNVEQRTGAAVPGVALVWLSALFAALQYYDVLPLAGQLLGGTALWITVAGALVTDTWRINNEVKPEPLYPYKRKGFKSRTRLLIESFEGFEPTPRATLVNRVAEEAMVNRVANEAMAAVAAAAVVGAVAPEEEQEDETSQQRKARVKAKMDAALIGDASSTVVMERLKAAEDQDGGVSQLLGRFLLLLDPSGIVRRRLWTRADFMHIHAVSGAYFLFLGIPWLFYSHIVNAMDISVPMETSSWFLTSLLLAGLVNALSAVPMSRFTSNKIMDVKDLKANGFTFGGTGLTCMCLYIAYWFSGDYPNFLRPFDIPIFLFWALVCAGTSVNWEVMLQQNFEANERTTVKQSKDEMNKKAILYRIASWPNLTQLMFMYSIPFGGSAWLRAVEEQWPMQNTPMYHYGIASALGYALSMFSETLRDRKLVTLDQDLALLIIGFVFPMVSVVIDGFTYGSAVSISPAQYWVLFGFGT
eukprot:jgi/Chrpa1/11332/Chrysochromulina_OHIO_Genome00016952-RA